MKTRNYFQGRVAFIFTFLFLSISAFSQKETVIYFGANGRLTTLKHAEIMLKISEKSASTTMVQSLKLEDAKWEKEYLDKYKKQNDTTYLIKSCSATEAKTLIRIFIPQPDGSFAFKDIYKGQLVRSGHSKTKIPLTLHGQVTEFYSNGQKKSVSEYANNELVSNQNWNGDGSKYIDNIFYSTDVEPTFIPGNDVLRQHFLKAFNDAGIDVSTIAGSIVIGFVVMEDGVIDGIKVLKGLAPNINSIAGESFLSLKGKWTPAKLNNQNVRFFQVFPINFLSKQTKYDFAVMGKLGELQWGAY